MSRTNSIGRRTVLQILSALFTTAVVAAPSAGSVSDSVGATPPDDASSGESAFEHRKDSREPVRGFYVATVDRIVDGDHVVVLLEAGEEVVEQVVLPSDDYPSLEENMKLLVYRSDDGLTVLFGT